jgi:hypothetical protein
MEVKETNADDRPARTAGEDVERLRAALNRACEYAVDARSGRLGEVMGRVGGYVQLRPIGGGREWDCPPESAEPAAPEEVLRERVRRLNRESVSGIT